VEFKGISLFDGSETQEELLLLLRISKIDDFSSIYIEEVVAFADYLNKYLTNQSKKHRRPALNNRNDS